MEKRTTKIDKKLIKRGFIKIKKTQFVLIYDRPFNLRHSNRCKCRVEIHHIDGKHLLQIKPYNMEKIDDEGRRVKDDTTYGLTYKETKLFLKKMKEMHWC